VRTQPETLGGTQQQFHHFGDDKWRKRECVRFVMSLPLSEWKGIATLAQHVSLCRIQQILRSQNVSQETE
jgi:hypothetical protein